MDNRIGGVIDMRGSPYQTCWQCGELAGGREPHVYYGNFPFGVEHGHCGERIRKILDRSLRALSALDNNSVDQTTREAAKRALITTSARLFGNCTLDKIQDDYAVRKVVESKGMTAALQTFRALSGMDDNTWQIRLEDHRRIMQGPELLKPERTKEDIATIKEIEELVMAGVEDECLRKKERNQALKTIASQLKFFVKDCKNGQNTAPYCIIGDIIAPYYRSSGSLEKLLREINDNSQWRVLFLANEVQDPSYKNITHIVVERIALIPFHISIDEAKSAWQKEYSPETGKADVFTLHCLEWRNHWIFIEEIGSRISLGERSKDRSNL